MKLLLWLCAVLLLTATVGRCDGVGAVLPHVVWRDTETKAEIFSDHDVVAFDPKSQQLLLSPQKSAVFSAWAQGLHRELDVVDQDGVIYTARYVNDASSMGYSGPVYQPGVPIRIVNGYPSGSGFGWGSGGFSGVSTQAEPKQDERFSARLESDLKQLGVVYALGGAPQSRALLPLDFPIGWRTVGDRVSLWTNVPDKSLVVGEAVSGSVFFSFEGEANSLAATPPFDFVMAEIEVVANGGRFASRSTSRAFAFKDLVQNKVAKLEFSPWKGLEGSQLPTEKGEAQLTLSLLFQKRQGKKLVTLSRLIYATLTTPVQIPDAVR